MNKKKKKSKDYIIEFSETPRKHVRFNDMVEIHIIEIEDRKGYWVEDRFRFQQRCSFIKNKISSVFEEAHRQKMKSIVDMSYKIIDRIANTKSITKTISYSYVNISQDLKNNTCTSLLMYENRPIYYHTLKTAMIMRS